MKISAFPSTIHESVLEQLKEKLEKAKKAYATIAFFTLKKEDLTSKAWGRLKDDGYICVDINYPTDFDAIDSLQSEVDFYLYLKRTNDKAMKKEYKKPPSRHYKRPRYKLHSKFILLDYGENSEVIVGSHNWTKAALKGGNIEQGISIEDETNSPIISQFKSILKEIKAECEKYDPANLEDYKNLQIDETKFEQEILSFEIEDSGRAIEKCPEFIVASKDELPPIALRAEIRLKFGRHKQRAVVEKLVGKEGTEAEMGGVPVAIWESGKEKSKAKNSVNSRTITNSGNYDYYHIRKLPLGSCGESEPIQEDETVTKERYWREMEAEEVKQDKSVNLEKYAIELGIKLEDLFLVKAENPVIIEKGKKKKKGPFSREKK